MQNKSRQETIKMYLFMMIIPMMMKANSRKSPKWLLATISVSV